jgi:hypothetical protein
MAHDLPGLSRRAFQQLETGNPLEEFPESDRILLCSMLLLEATIEKADRQSDEDPFKRAAALAREAGRLGARLETEVFHGPYSDLMPFTSGFSDLPERLAEFSKIVGEVMAPFGGPGHEGKVFDVFSLILATEFVRLRTGHFYDETLAELYQYVSGRRKHFSADTIRRRRDRLKEQSPHIYSWMLERARRANESSAARDSS